MINTIKTINQIQFEYLTKEELKSYEYDIQKRLIEIENGVTIQDKPIYYYARVSVEFKGGDIIQQRGINKYEYNLLEFGLEHITKKIDFFDEYIGEVDGPISDFVSIWSSEIKEANTKYPSNVDYVIDFITEWQDYYNLCEEDFTSPYIKKLIQSMNNNKTREVSNILTIEEIKSLATWFRDVANSPEHKEEIILWHQDLEYSWCFDNVSWNTYSVTKYAVLMYFRELYTKLAPTYGFELDDIFLKIYKKDNHLVFDVNLHKTNELGDTEFDKLLENVFSIEL